MKEEENYEEARNKLYAMMDKYDIHLVMFTMADTLVDTMGKAEALLLISNVVENEEEEHEINK